MCLQLKSIRKVAGLAENTQSSVQHCIPSRIESASASRPVSFRICSCEQSRFPKKMASRAQELPLRSEQHRSVKQHGAETGSRAKEGDSSAADAGGAAGTGTQQQQLQQQIIECRKKNSRGQSVVTHRYYKGRLLGKVSVR